MSLLWISVDDEGDGTHAQVGPRSNVRLLGSGTMFGVTEFGDLSDPPRKYKLLESSKAAIARATALLPNLLVTWNYNTSAYNTAGTRIEQIGFLDGNATPGLLTDAVLQLGTAAGAALGGAGNSLEDVALPAAWLPYAPTWTRGKTEKSYASAAVPTAPGEGRFLYHLANAYGRAAGGVGSSRGLGVRNVTFAGDHWSLVVDVGGDGVGIGTAVGPSAYMKLANGNTDPGLVGLSDTFIGKAPDQPAAAGNCFGSFSINLPLDCSVRFMVKRGSQLDQVPQQITTKYTNGVAGASGLTVSAYDGWLYLPATDTIPWAYSSRLANEDTPQAAFLRGSFPPNTTDTGETARTTSATGGITAESASPIVLTGWVVTASQLFRYLINGNLYSYVITWRDNTIGMTDYTFPVEAARTFVATGLFQTESISIVAPVGKERIVYMVALSDLGPYVPPTPVPAYQSETLVWEGRVLAAGGTLTVNSLTLADDWLVQLKTKAYFGKLVYLLPMLGGNLTAALIPLLDVLAKGATANTGFVDADFSETTGLQGDGVAKKLQSPVKPSELNGTTANNGGMFFWEVQAMAARVMCGYGTATGGDTRFFLAGGATNTNMTWGLQANNAVKTPSPGIGLNHAQRSSATRRDLIFNGVSVASNTTNDPATDANAKTMPIFCFNNAAGVNSSFWPGRCGLWGMETGDMSAADVLDFYTTSLTYLLQASGKVP